MALGTGHPWIIRDRALPLDRPLVMGILNVTPDSFSDGGRFRDAGPALARARELAAAGADLLDVGGESTRPGAEAVSPEEEMERILPVIRGIRGELDVPVSVDTRHAQVARAALEAGAQVVNDVSGLGDPEMAATVAEFEAGLVLMHMRGTPATMQSHTGYGDVAAEVTAELLPRIARARAAGIGDTRVVLDPGIGFAKTAEQNLELIARLRVLGGLGFPLLLGPSRKAFIGRILGGIPADERDAGTVGACVAGLARGARIFRVHEVRGARQALDVAWSILRIPAEAA